LACQIVAGTRHVHRHPVRVGGTQQRWNEENAAGTKGDYAI
jgi:hypothetical protein